MKGGQVTVFVIVGILLVAAVIAFFVVYQNRAVISSFGEEFDLESFVSKCFRDSVREKIDIMMPQGGFLSPTDYKVFDDSNVAYICKTINYYEPCVAQYPRYITRVQEELESGIEDDVGNCFILLEDELEKRNYDVQAGGLFDIKVVLKPEIVDIVVSRNLQLSGGDFSRDFNSFRSSIRSPLYDLGYVANEIARQEAKYCYFEYLGYSLIYNNFDIRKYSLSDSTKIYTVEHKPSGETMNIAIRGCAIPPGF